MFKTIIIIFSLIKIFSVHAHAQTPTVLISIDGFANHYLDEYQPTNILKIANKGVLAKALHPVYPSKTFPNHVSIVTGVYPGKHGIVHNKFYHRELAKTYQLGAGKNDATWLTALPFWTLLEQNNRKSAIYFWPESETTVQGVLPSYLYPFDKKTSGQARIDKIIEWLKLPSAKRPEFIASYFSLVDTAGHHSGPHSNELVTAIKKIDSLIGQLVNRIEHEVPSGVNLILVSDHGMVQTGVQNAVDWQQVVGDFTSNKNMNIVSGQTQLYIYSDSKSLIKDVRSQITTHAFNNNKYTVYQQGSFPEHWHLNERGPAIPDLIIEAIPPYTFTHKDKYVSTASHGYDSKNVAKLNGIFIANGPAFKEGYVNIAFSNVNVFPLLAYLHNVKISHKIDGEFVKIKEIIKK
jgi:predicted AlkP superfamily pyrophosphatase or phosphodiesterase